MQPSDSLPPVGRGSGRPWPVAYPVPRATRRKKGLPGAWAVLFQRAVGSDPAGCASRLAHRVETAIAFRLHNALGTQNERYFVAVNPTAHSLACLRIGVFVTADAARLAPGVGGSPFTGRVSHPLDGKQSFMTSPHRHSPLTSLAWSHRAPTPPVRSMATRSGTFARIRLRAAVRRQSWRNRVGTPVAWQAVRQAVRQRRTGMPSRWKTSWLSGSRRARRRARDSAMGGEMGVGARMRAGLRASNRRARHLPMRYETGLPSSVIRFRTLHASTASRRCPDELRARRQSPTIDLYRKNAFSTRAC